MVKYANHGVHQKKSFIWLGLWCGVEVMEWILSLFSFGAEQKNLGKGFILAHLACNILSLTVLFGPSLAHTDAKHLAEGINNVPRGPERPRAQKIPHISDFTKVEFLFYFILFFYTNSPTPTSSFTITMENLNPICLY